jgi:hypothetical protein
LARSLTTHQKAVLIQVLLAFPEQEVGVWYSPSASDGLAYAQDFVAIFKAIGWKVTGPESADLPAGPSAGLALVASKESGVPASAEALRDALRIYGIEVEILCDASRRIASGNFVLSIGLQ